MKGVHVMFEHLDIGAFIKILIDTGIDLLRLIGLVKPMLDTTKTGIEVFEEGRKLLEEATPSPDKPELVAERVRAASDLIRSFAPIAFAEVGFWALRAFFLLGVIHAYLEFYRIRKASK
jgi:hypothetical protein